MARVLQWYEVPHENEVAAPEVTQLFKARDSMAQYGLTPEDVRWMGEATAEAARRSVDAWERLQEEQKRALAAQHEHRRQWRDLSDALAERATYVILWLLLAIAVVLALQFLYRWMCASRMRARPAWRR